MSDTVKGMDTNKVAATDRCDRCGAKAYVRADAPGDEGLSLRFCSHHGKEHAPALKEKGFKVSGEEMALLGRKT